MATPGVSGFGNTMNQIAVGLAQQKYMMEQQRQAMAMKQAELASQMMHQRAQEALYGAQVESDKAQGEHYRAQSNKLNQEQEAAGKFGDVMEGMSKYPATAPDLMPIAMGQAARLSGQGQHFVPENMAQLLQMQNPQMQQVMAAGGAGKLYHNVPAGATAISPVPGVSAVMGGVTLPQGANLMAPQAIDFHQLLNGQVPQMKKVAEGQPKPTANNLGQFFGPMVNLRGQGMSSGVVLNPNDPTFSAVDQALKNVLPFVTQRMTNNPTQQVTQPQGGKPAMGGYIVGRKYNGITYNGGDPHDENNWTK
jgi:hypothetical protein